MGYKIDTSEIFKKIHNINPGPKQTAAYIEEIRKADMAGDPYARLSLRASMAVFVPFFDDATKILPYCAEFFQIAEEHPEAASA